jgi:cytochrome P450
MHPEILLDLYRAQGDVAQFWYGERHAYLVSHPELIAEVFTNRSGALTKPNRGGWKDLLPLLSLSSRPLLSPFARSAERLTSMAAAVELAQHGLCAALDTQCRKGLTRIDAGNLFRRVLLEWACASFFEVDLSERSAAFVNAAYAVHRAAFVSSIADADAPTVSNAELARCTSTGDAGRTTMREIGLSIARKRLPEAEAAHDNDVLGDEISALLVLSYESAATTLAWALTMTARHPRLIQAIREGTLSAASELARAITLETLRLYPPGWWTRRIATRQCTLGPITLEEGNMVVVSPYVVHRSPSLWDDAEAFEPNRFTKGSTHLGHWTFFPFGSGKWKCPAGRIALPLLEGLLLLICRRFDFDIDPEVGTSCVPIISLRPYPDLTATFAPRRVSQLQ